MVDIADPVILVEVVSPSSRGIDSGVKLAGYFRLPSVRRCARQRRPGDHPSPPRRRREIAARILQGGALELAPPGITIAAVDLLLAP